MQRSDIEQAYAATNEKQDEIRADRPLLRDNEKVIDLERQLPRAKEEQSESRFGTTAYLGLYFMMNLSLTFYNKLVLGKVSCFLEGMVHKAGAGLTTEQFAFPWILTAIHTGTSALGCSILLLLGHFELSKLSMREQLTLVAFSLLFTLNIAMSNVSL